MLYVVLYWKQSNRKAVWPDFFFFFLFFFWYHPYSILTFWILNILLSIRCGYHYQIDFDVGFSALLITEYQQEQDRFELCYVVSSVVKL